MADLFSLSFSFFLPFCSLTILLDYLLTCIVSAEESVICDLLYVRTYFLALVVSTVFILSLLLSHLIVLCLGVIFFIFFLSFVPYFFHIFPPTSSSSSIFLESRHIYTRRLYVVPQITDVLSIFL